MAFCKKAILVYSRLILLGSLHVLFVALVLARVLESSNWSWAAVFSPLFFLDIIAIIYLVFYLFGLVRDKTEGISRDHNTACFPYQQASPVPPIFYTTGLVFKIVSEILLVLHLDKILTHFFVSGIFIMCMFLTLTVGLLVYSLKPNISEIRER